MDVCIISNAATDSNAGNLKCLLTGIAVVNGKSTIYTVDTGNTVFYI